MNFMILAAGRSGSTLLVNYLSSHPHVRCHHEPFNQNGWHAELKGYDRSIEALNHLDANSLSIPIHRKISSFIQKWGGIHRGKLIIDPFKNSDELVSEGFKVTWAQTKMMYGDMENWLSSNNEMKCIFLYRYDYLARFISYELAHSNDLWNSSYRTHNTEPFKVSRIRFKQFCDRELGLEEKLWNLIQATKVNVSVLSYEDLVENPLKHVNLELAFLGCGPLETVESLTTKLVRSPVEKLVTNYENLGSNAFVHKKRLERIKQHNASHIGD